MDHAEIIFQRVQAQPGQGEFFAVGILVKGLVHMPQDGQACFRIHPFCFRSEQNSGKTLGVGEGDLGMMGARFWFGIEHLHVFFLQALDGGLDIVHFQGQVVQAAAFFSMKALMGESGPMGSRSSMNTSWILKKATVTFLFGDHFRAQVFQAQDIPVADDLFGQVLYRDGDMVNFLIIEFSSFSVFGRCGRPVGTDCRCRGRQQLFYAASRRISSRQRSATIFSTKFLLTAALFIHVAAFLLLEFLMPRQQFLDAAGLP